MKLLIVLYCLAATVLANKYTDRFDNIDIKEVLQTKRLLLAYHNCLMDRGKCNAAAKEIKANVMDALENGCEKCTDVQKENVTITFEHLIRNEIDIWNELCSKYDPDGKWRKKYEEEAKKKGIIIPPY